MDPSLISKFCSVTNGSEEEALYYLEAFNGDCDEALKNYFDSRDEDNNFSENVDLAFETQNLHNSKLNNSSKIATLSSLNHQNDSDSDDGQAFYVGGSERGGGGQQVLGPPKKDENSQFRQHLDTFVHDLFSAAKDRGAEVLESEGHKEPSVSRKVFTGTGYRLGDDPNVASEVCISRSSPNNDSNLNGINERSIAVKMWRDGYSWDDGPLHSYTDPGANEFFNALKSGGIPQELMNSANGGMVAVMLEDHHHEDWRPSATKFVPFSGVGCMLGSPTPFMETDSKNSDVINKFVGPKVEVDDSKPITEIQIRFPDGERFIIHLNHDHTVADIRNCILSQRPDLLARSFNLMTFYPNSMLDENDKSLKEANLLNSALLIRYI